MLAVAAETVSVLAFAFSRRRLLQVSGRPPSRRAMIGITYAGSALSMSLPFAGTGLATIYSYRQFRRRGRRERGRRGRVRGGRGVPGAGRGGAARRPLRPGALNWAADCAALALAIRATGLPVPWHALLPAYGAGAAVGSTGLTPGGFGLVELAAAAALTARGLPASGALASVLAYRLANFWLIIGTGWLIMLRPGGRPGPDGEPGT